MADLIDFVKRKCLLHMCKHGKVISNKVRIRSVQRYPSQVPEVGYPQQGWGIPPARSDGRGVPKVGYPSRDGVPPARSNVGYPWWGTPSRDGYPSQMEGTQGGVPPGRDGVPPRQGYHPYRTTDGVLDTPRSVCLLRSRRRSFLC